MTTAKLLELIKARGLTIALKNGRPVLEKANREQVTDALLAVLANPKLPHRERIIKMLEERGE
jgi:hypothetical protein